MMQWITDNNNLISMIITMLFTIPAGLFAFLKWIDSRNQMLKNQRYEKYLQLMKTLSGSRPSSDSHVSMTEQISSVWFLLEYKEYYKITLKVLDNSDLETIGDPNWTKFVVPQVKKLIEEIKRQ